MALYRSMRRQRSLTPGTAVIPAVLHTGIRQYCSARQNTHTRSNLFANSPGVMGS